MISPSYSEFSYTPASSFPASTDALPTIRTAVKSAFPDLNWNSRTPGIGAIDLRSASPFTVKLNEETQIQAVGVGSTYVLQYSGVITEVTPVAEVTFSSVWVAYAIENA